MSVCLESVPVFLSWWGFKPEYTQTHGDLCHGWGPKLRSSWGKQAYKSHRMKFFENLKLQKVSCKG